MSARMRVPLRIVTGFGITAPVMPARLACNFPSAIDSKLRAFPDCGVAGDAGNTLLAFPHNCALFLRPRGPRGNPSFTLLPYG